MSKPKALGSTRTHNSSSRRARRRLAKSSNHRQRRRLLLERLEQRELLAADLFTDRSSYGLEERVLITAEGFQPGETVEFQVTRLDGETAVDPTIYEPWQIVDGSQFDEEGGGDIEDGGPFDLIGGVDGRLQTQWAIGDREPDEGEFKVQATGLTSGLVVITIFAGVEIPPYNPPDARVATDKDDYQPGETAVITATGFDEGETVVFQVLHTDDIPNTGEGHEPWQVTDGGEADLDGEIDGNVRTDWLVSEDDSLDSTFEVTASGLTSGEVATAQFTDDLVTLHYDNFQSGTIKSSKWSYVDAGLDRDANHRSGPHAASHDYLVELDGNDEELRSNTINTSNYLWGKFTYQVQQTGHENPPEAGDTLKLQYLSRSGSWKTLRTETVAKNPDPEKQYARTVYFSNDDAFHRNFQYRFNAYDSDVRHDDWFVDAIGLYAEPNRTPTASTSGSGGSRWDHQSSTFSWSVHDADANLEYVSARVKRGSTTTNTYSWSGASSSSKSGSFTPDIRRYGLGTYTLTVDARDTRDRTVSTSRSFTVNDDDVDPPQVTLGGSQGSERHTLDQQFYWSVFDSGPNVPDGVPSSPSGVAWAELSLAKDGDLLYTGVVNNPASGTNSETYTFVGAEGKTLDDYVTEHGPGAYTLTVVAQDGDNDRSNDGATSSPVSRTVVITNEEPVAVPGLNQTVKEGDAVSFSGQASYDPDGEPVTYAWDFGDGGSSTAAAPQHAYQDDGVYRVWLTVTDRYGLQSRDRLDVTVLNAAPVITSVTNNGPVDPGQPVTITAAATDVSGDTLTFEFDVDNDGIVDVENTSGTVTHTFADAGVYPVNVRVTDGDGGEANSWTAVAVGDPLPEPPVVEFGSVDATVEEDVDIVTLTATLSEPIAATALAPVVLSGSAVNGVDYTLAYSYFAFAPGETVARLDISILDDESDEFDEQIIVTLGTPLNATLGNESQNNVSIVDNDHAPTVSFTQTRRFTPENSGHIELLVRVDEPSGKPISIPINLSGTADLGMDYAVPNGTELTLAPNAHATSLSIEIIDDDVAEANQSIIASMGEPTNAGKDSRAHTQVLLIPANDAPGVSFTTAYTQTDEGETVSLDVVLSTPFESEGEITYSTAESIFKANPETEPWDFDVTLDPDLTFEPGSVGPKKIHVAIQDDSLGELRESVVVTLGAAEGTEVREGQIPRTVIDIVPNDTPKAELSILGPPKRWEGLFFDIQVTLSQASQEHVRVPINVNGGTMEPENYWFSGSTTIDFIPGATFGTLRVYTRDDRQDNGHRTLQLGIGDPENALPHPLAPTEQTLTILDNDVAIHLTPPSALEEKSGIPGLDIDGLADFLDLGLDDLDLNELAPYELAVSLSEPTDHIVNARVHIDDLSAVRKRDTKIDPFTLARDAPDFLVVVVDPSGVSVAPGDVNVSILPGLTSSLTQKIFVIPTPNIVSESTEFFRASVTSSRDFPDRPVNVRINDDDSPPEVHIESLVALESWESSDFYVWMVGVSDRTVTVPVHWVHKTNVRYSGRGQEVVDSGTIFVEIPAGRLGGTGTVTWEDDLLWERTENIRLTIGKPINAVRASADYSDYIPLLEVPVLHPFNADVNGESEPWQMEEYRKDQIDAFLGKSIKNAIIPGSGNLQAEVTYRWFGIDGSIDQGVAFFDGNKNGLVDFLDLNRDGVQDPNEPSEPVGVTELDGSFEISIPAQFDVNEDGSIGLEEGRLMVVGGRDASRDAELQFPLIAPVGSAVVTPLTTLMTNLVENHGYTIMDAKTRIREALQLPDVDFTQVNPVSGSMGGDATAARLYATGAILHDTYTQVANLASGVAGAPSDEVMAELFMADLGEKIAAAGSRLNLSHPIVMETIIDSVLGLVGLEADSAIVAGGAAVIVAGNQAIESLELNAGEDYLRQVAKVQVVAQGEAATQLAAASQGQVDIETVVTQFTGAALAAKIEAANTGIVAAPLLSIADTQAVEADDGSSMMEFTVSISRAPTTPVSVNFAAMRDDTATAGEDFEQVSGTLHWAAGDDQPKSILVPIHGDTDYEDDEQFRVLLAGPVNAVVESDVAYGAILNDDALSYHAPDTESNELQLLVDSQGYTLFRNEEPVLQQDVLGDAPVVIHAAAGVANSLTVEITEETTVLDSGLTFIGASQDDRLELRAPLASTVSHQISAAGDGQFSIDSTTIIYSGVETLTQDLLPTVDGVPSIIREADVVTVSVGAELDEVDSVAWTFTRGTEELATGTDSSFTFSPADDGSYALQLASNSGTWREGTVTVLLNVENVAPTFEAGPDETLPPQVVGQFERLAIRATDPGDDTLSGEVDYGDGVVRNLVIDQESGEFDLRHTYTRSGDFTVTVTVEDEDGGSTIDTFQVEAILAEVEFTSDVFAEPENGDASATLQLRRSPEGTEIASQVRVAIVGGTAEADVDYDDDAFPLLLTFEAGIDVVTAPIPLIDENIVELNETIQFEVTAVNNAVIADRSTATFTISNDDSATLNLDSQEGDEDGGPITFTASLTNPVDTQVTVRVSTTDGSATAADNDFAAVDNLALTFDTNVVSQSFVVETTADSKVELDESFNLSLTSLVSAGRAVSLGDNGSGVIRNDDSASMQIDDVSQVETHSGVTQLVFTVTLSEQVDSEVTIIANTHNGTARVEDQDYQAVENLTVRFPAANEAGPQTQTVAVNIEGDLKVEPQETLTLVLSSLDASERNVLVADEIGDGRILNDDFFSGRVFDDRRNDGFFDPTDGDVGIADVTMKLIDEASNAVVHSATTDASGNYQFDITLDAGSYRIEQVFDDPATDVIEDELSELGMLDGREFAGVNGGSRDNTRDSNAIRGIEVGSDGPASVNTGYLFAELQPASIQGLVWEDYDNDASVDFGELMIDDVLISLSGVDDRGNAVSLSQRTDLEGIYEFTLLRPGTYGIHESAPTKLQGETVDFDDGLESLGEVDEMAPGVVLGADGRIADNDQFGSITIVAGAAAVNYNFGERIDGGAAPNNSSKGIGFWQNKQGRSLIEGLNGGADSTLLGQYLTTTFPGMYGDDGSGFSSLDLNQDGDVTNTEVADSYRRVFKRKKSDAPAGPPKLDAQVMAVALATYITKESFVSVQYATNESDESLISEVRSYGLVVTVGGLGSSTYNVGRSGAAFGVADNSNVRVIDLLLAVDEQSHEGLLFDVNGDGVIDEDEELLRTLAHDVFAARRSS